MGKPINVRIQRADGTMLDCELEHVGTDAEGDHWWIKDHVVDLPGGDHVTAEEIPARTSLGFRTPEVETTINPT